MGNKGVRVVGIFGILIIVLVMVINIPMNTQPNPQTSNCELFENDGSCAKFEYDTIVTENLNSFIDANNDLTQTPSIDVGSEKIILITNSVLLDSNQEIVSNSTDKIAFEPATLLDLQKNILDLGSVQMTFDIRYKKNANVFFDGEAEVFLDGISKGKRYLSFNGQLPENTVRVNVDKESKLLSDRTKTLTFTLANEGKDWVDGSVHLLEIKVKNLKAQVTVNGAKQEFDLGNDFPVYRLEMTVDQAKQVTFDENHNAISIFKNDGVLVSCGDVERTYEKPYRAKPTGTVIGYEQYRYPSLSPPNVDVFVKNERINLVPIPDGKCTNFVGIPRNSELVFRVADVDYPVKSGMLKPEYGISVKWSENIAVSSSNFGWDKPDVDYGVGHLYART